MWENKAKKYFYILGIITGVLMIASVFAILFNLQFENIDLHEGSHNDSIHSSILTADALITTATVTLIAFNGSGARNSGSSSIIRNVFWKITAIPEQNKKTQFLWGLTFSFLAPVLVICITLLSTTLEISILNVSDARVTSILFKIFFSITIVMFISTVFRTAMFNLYISLEASSSFIKRKSKSPLSKNNINKMIMYLKGSKNFELTKALLTQFGDEKASREDIIAAFKWVKGIGGNKDPDSLALILVSSFIGNGVMETKSTKEPKVFNWKFLALADHVDLTNEDLKQLIKSLSAMEWAGSSEPTKGISLTQEISKLRNAVIGGEVFISPIDKFAEFYQLNTSTKLVGAPTAVKEDKEYIFVVENGVNFTVYIDAKKLGTAEDDVYIFTDMLVYNKLKAKLDKREKYYLESNSGFTKLM